MDHPDDTSSAEDATADGSELPDDLAAKLRISIPGYELLDSIKSGGQGTVYRARETGNGQTVAIKVLHGGIHAAATSRKRFDLEIATLKVLKHPNIVKIIESGQTPLGLDFLVMDYIDGRPLDAIWTDAAFAAVVAPEPPARLRLFKRICDAMQVAHLRGITHRDLSPSNILITADGEPHIIDFGLMSNAFNALLSPAGADGSLTGHFLGKLHYAAPEQASGARDVVDIRTDVYALGVILYQILTNGCFPYQVAGNLLDVLHNIMHTKPLPPSAVFAARYVSIKHSVRLKHPPEVNEAIEAIVLKALEKAPGDRYQSAGALAADIEEYLAGRPIANRHRADHAPVHRVHAARCATIVGIVLLAAAAGTYWKFAPTPLDRSRVLTPAASDKRPASSPPPTAALLATVGAPRLTAPRQIDSPPTEAYWDRLGIEDVKDNIRSWGPAPEGPHRVFTRPIPPAEWLQLSNALNDTVLIYCDGGSGTDATVKQLARLPKLAVLGLGDQPVSDAGIAALRENRSLIGLDLAGTRLTGKAIADVATIRHLDVLNLGASVRGDRALKPLLGCHLRRVSFGDMTDEDLVDLAGHPTLEAIRIDAEPGSVTSKCADALASIPSIQILSLGWTDIGDEGMTKLAKLPKLRRLDAPGDCVHALGLASLAQCNNLTWFSLEGRGHRDLFTDQDLAAIGSLTQLKFLGLCDSSLRDEQLERLSNTLPHLDRIYVRNTPVTEKGLGAVLRNCPELYYLNAKGSQASPAEINVLRQRYPAVTLLCN